MIDATITFLGVADLDRSHRFYADGLGLTLILDQGACRIYRVSRDGYLGLCQREDPASTGVVFTIVTDDVADWHRRFVSAGGDVDGPPQDDAGYGIHHFFGTDPDGNLLEVQRFADPDWAAP